MANKKFYAVKKGKITGVFEKWEECKASVDGFPGAIYKGFGTREEAQSFLGYPKRKDASTAERPKQGTLLAYVDGSYDDSLKKYAFGCVFLLPDGRIFTQYGNGDKEESLALRNVTGEMLGAMYAVKTAINNGYSEIELRFDYQGIEKWVTGEWRAKTDLTQKYAASMREWGKKIRIKFTKVAAHTNVTYNELADKTAKMGLAEGNGVPKICRIDEMMKYDRC